MLTAIRQWVVQTMMKGQTGVVRTLPKNDLIELNTQITIERMLRNGINPDDMKTVGQVENVVKQIDTPKVNVNPGVTGVKKADVLDMEGNKIPEGSGIMGGKEVKESDAAIKARIEADNEKGIASMKDKKIQRESLEDYVDDAGGVNPDDPRGIDDFIPDPEEKADGGRIGLLAGSVTKVLKLLKNKKRVQQAVDDIFPTGDYKYDAQMAADALVENNPKTFGGKLYEDLDMDTQMEVYGAVIGPIQSNALTISKMKKATRPEKTLASMEEGKGIDMSDPGISEEFTRFMKETDPEGYKKLEQTVELSNFKTKGRKENSDGGRIGLFMGGANTAGKSVLRQILNYFGKKSDSVKNPSDILRIVNPKRLNELLENPEIYRKFDIEKGIAAPDLIKNMQKQMNVDRKKTIQEMLSSAKNIKSADDNTIKYKNEMIEDMIKKGVDRKMAEEMAGTISKMAENAAGKTNTPKLTDEGILQLENILKNMETGGKKARDLNADGGRIGLKGAGFINFIKNMTMNKKSPLQFGKDYLKNVKDKTLKANETGKFMDLPIAEVGIPAATGALVNNQIRKKLENMNEAQKEENLKMFIRELENDEFYDKYPDIKDEMIADYTERLFGVEKADGGRIGLKGGMNKRTFLKLMGSVGAGIGAVKSGIFSGLGKGAGKTVAKEVAQQTTSTYPPPYFFKLAEKIKFMGDDVVASQDKAIAKKYKDYVLEEDFAGNISIVRKGDMDAPGYEEVYMGYSVDDVPIKGKKGSTKVEEYEEYTVKPDEDGKMKDVEDGVPDDVIDDAGDPNSMTIKKASGGIARMLGE
jgi:hypothetical protein